jgi:hypothetical protein
MAYEMRSLQGRPGRYAVFEGEIQRSGILSKDGAEDFLETVEKRARRRQRDCLCCGRAFLSEGVHNRLCSRCRAAG